MMNKAVIALGSNIMPETKIPEALDVISQVFLLKKKSRFVYTRPVGYEEQDDFLNGAVLVETERGEKEIISTLKDIEQKLGRKRDGRKDGPRKIDLDLVLFNDRIVDDDVFELDFLKRSVQQVLPQFKLRS